MNTDHHVRFASGTHLVPEPIHLLQSDDPSLPPEAHVGILRNHHTYSVDIPIPHSMGPEVSARHAPTNINFMVVAAPETVAAKVESEDGCKFVSMLKLQAKTIKEGSIAEKVELSVEGGSSMELLLTAKVLKANQGNPVLKEGVHMISHEHGDESDFTEWPGFSKAADDEKK